MTFSRQSDQIDCRHTPLPLHTSNCTVAITMLTVKRITHGARGKGAGVPLEIRHPWSQLESGDFMQTFLLFRTVVIGDVVIGVEVEIIFSHG